MAAYIRRHLEPAYRVIEAARGDLGLRLAAEELPDLIVSDIMMPGMDGYSLCRALKADPKLDCIPVILLTARVELDDKLEGFECGADEYLTKPFNSRELMARVRNLLQARDRLDDHVRAEASRMALRPAPLQTLSEDERFLRRVRGVLEMEGCDPAFGVDALAQRLSLSRMHLYRRLHGLTQASPSDLLIGFRLEKAAQMLAQGAGNATQVAFAVGFKDSSHFSKRFRDRYGLSPAAYAASHESQSRKP